MPTPKPIDIRARKSPELDLGACVDVALVERRPISHAAPAYYGWASKPRIAAADSSNHGLRGMDCDACNLANGFPTVLPRDAQVLKVLAYATGPLLDREALPRHQYGVMAVDSLRTQPPLWRELGRPDIAEALDIHRLAVFAHVALGAANVEACTFSAAEIDRDGPGCFVADREPDRGTRGEAAITSCGARNANTKPTGTVGRKPPPGAKTPWRDLSPCLFADHFDDALDLRLDARGLAIQKRGHDGHYLTAEQAEVMKAATRGDAAALRIVWQWASARPPAKRFRYIRRSSMVATLSLAGKDGSTANLDGAEVLLPSGVMLFLVANTGARQHKGGPDAVKPTHTEVTEDGRLAVAQVDDGELEAATMRLAAGETYFDVEIGGDEPPVQHVVPWAAETEPPPGPGVTPPPAPRKPSWWERFVAKLPHWLQRRLS